MEWLICAFAGILSGIIGGMGMGGGGVLIIYLNISPIHLKRPLKELIFFSFFRQPSSPLSITHEKSLLNGKLRSPYH